MTNGNNDNTMISFPSPLDLKNELKEAAREDDVSMSTLCRQAIKAYLDLRRISKMRKITVSGLISQLG